MAGELRDELGEDLLMTPGEVAALFRVDVKTVARWTAAGKLATLRTPGGHHRYWRSDVRAFLDGREVPGS